MNMPALNLRVHAMTSKQSKPASTTACMSAAILAPKKTSKGRSGVFNFVASKLAIIAQRLASYKPLRVY